MIQELILIFLGVGGLIYFSDIIVNIAERIALRLGVSPLIIGLTIVSIGTSLPEIATNLGAGVGIKMGLKSSGIAVGNIVGSQICQITLILGVVGLVATLKPKPKELIRDGIWMIIAIVALFVAAWDYRVTQMEGAVLCLTYILYLVYLLYSTKATRLTPDKSNVQQGSLAKDLFLTVICCVFLIVSSGLVVDNGVAIAKILEVPIYLVGLLVGLGTSLPELSVSLAGIRKKAPEISLGNLIGSNITDPLFSLGLGASIAGFSVTHRVLMVDIPILLGITIIALLMLTSKKHLGRFESLLLITFYLLFITAEMFDFFSLA